MNAERLRNAVDAVITDNTSANLVQLLANVESSYTQSVQSPTPQTAEAFSAAKKAFDEALRAGECMRLSPSRIAILERIGAADLCGSGLIEKVDSILATPVTPAAAVQGLQELRARAEKFYQTAGTLRTSLAALTVEGERPPTDAAEVEVRLPFELFDGALGGFAKEAKKLDGALSDVVETISGGRPPITIRSLAGGSVEIFLTVDPVSGVAILGLVTAIFNLINSVLQTRKTRLGLEKDKAPKDVLEPFAKWEQTRVADELARLRDELVAQSKLEKGRKNQLKISLDVSLKYLADRIDRGMDIDVAAFVEEGISPPPTEDNTPDSARRTAQRQIAESMKTRRRLLRPAEPVLALPPVVEPVVEEEDPGRSKEHPKKS